MTDLPAPLLPEGPPSAPFTSPEWVYELRFEGLPCMARVRPGASGDPARVRLRPAEGDMQASTAHPSIVQALAALPGGPHVLEGTIARRHAGGPPHAGSDRLAAEAFCVSDLLVHAGEDLTARPLVARKARLRELLQAADPSAVLACGDLPADADLLRALAATGLGTTVVLARRKDSAYPCARGSPDWTVVDPSLAPG